MQRKHKNMSNEEIDIQCKESYKITVGSGLIDQRDAPLIRTVSDNFYKNQVH